MDVNNEALSAIVNGQTANEDATLMNDNIPTRLPPKRKPGILVGVGHFPREGSRSGRR